MEMVSAACTGLLVGFGKVKAREEVRVGREAGTNLVMVLQDCWVHAQGLLECGVEQAVLDVELVEGGLASMFYLLAEFLLEVGVDSNLVENPL